MLISSVCYLNGMKSNQSLTRQEIIMNWMTSLAVACLKLFAVSAVATPSPTTVTQAASRQTFLQTQRRRPADDGVPTTGEQPIRGDAHCARSVHTMEGHCGGPWDPIFPPHGHPLGAPRRPRARTTRSSTPSSPGNRGCTRVLPPRSAATCSGTWRRTCLRCLMSISESCPCTRPSRARSCTA